MRQTAFRMAGVLAFSLLLAFRSSAQTQTLNIWPGIAPGSENWTQKERTIENTPFGAVIQNVVTPTLTVFLPDRLKFPESQSSRTGIIVAPGGACVALAIDHEGTKVARWLQEKGIAAFVLKYRLLEKKGEGIPGDLNIDEACKYGIADGIQALKVVRQHATEWGISADHVGIMGFSAGGMVTSGALLAQDAAARPNFAAPIYGGPFGAMPAVPAKLPPIFLAWTQDDDVARDIMTRFYAALTSAGNKPEVHIYSAGGHGFGIERQGTTSDQWIDEFYSWLEALGLTRPPTK